MRSVMQRFIRLLVVLVGICSFAAQADYDYTIVDYPGSVSTSLFAINNSGNVVGEAFFATGPTFNFVYDLKKKTFTLLPPVPGADFTGLIGITESGVIVGGAAPLPTDVSGVILSKKGTYTTFSHPGFDFTEGRGIGPSGLVTGWAASATGTVGFIYDPGRNRFTDFLPSDFTLAQGINGRGQVVGSTTIVGGPGTEPDYGFLRDAGGAIILFQVNGTSTAARGITDAGLIAGFVATPDGISSFVGSLSGAPGFQSLTIPAADLIAVPGAILTFAEGINNSGHVVGSSYDGNPDGFEHGFIAKKR